MSSALKTITLAGWLSFAAAVAAGQEPPLPSGLGEEAGGEPAGPALPEGLGGNGETGGPPGPALPEGLGDTGEPAAAAAADDTEAEDVWNLDDLPFDVAGFFETRFGPYVQRTPHQRDVAIAEARFQLELDWRAEAFAFHLTNDFVYDQVAPSRVVDLETGEGWSDLRELNVQFSPLPFMDVKAGRQVLTWGTGDLVFLNDLFPKDWNSFLIGRDVDYLKAPSDAVKASVFTDWVNLDVVYTPSFDADRFVDGRRVNFFDAGRGMTVGRNAILRVDRPQSWFEDEEWAARLYRSFGGWEVAGYYYRGFWKSPGGSDPTTGRAIFPELSAYGGSLRGPLGPGIFNAEMSWYDSRDDRGGDDPFVNNSELRFLLGYEQEVLPDFTVGLQYYLEYMLDHDEHLRALPAGAPARDRDRHVITARLTLLTMMQNLEWSLFVFVSPSDADAYLRPKVYYKIDDHWSAEVGGNVFIGKDEHTFFGQFRDNSNVYFALRYAF